jgi:hypothetical protein
MALRTALFSLHSLSLVYIYSTLSWLYIDLALLAYRIP